MKAREKRQRVLLTELRKAAYASLREEVHYKPPDYDVPGWDMVLAIQDYARKPVQHQDLALRIRCFDRRSAQLFQLKQPLMDEIRVEWETRLQRWLRDERVPRGEPIGNRAYRSGWVRIGLYDTPQRRSLWVRRSGNSLEICAGREGDDAYAVIDPSNPAYDTIDLQLWAVEMNKGK
jgi:hypothetical protein